jgi:hypothetical protein
MTKETPLTRGNVIYPESDKGRSQKPLCAKTQASKFTPARFDHHPVIASDRRERGNPSPQLVCVDYRAPTTSSLAMTNRA